jgi:hypothetical protein
MTRTNRRTLATLATALSAAGALVIAPAVGAGKPVRTPLPAEPLALDAGSSCRFDVVLTPQAGTRITQTEFDDGRVVIKTNGSSNVANADTGAEVTVRDHSTVTNVLDADANDLHIEASGQTIFYFFPGDQGPFGEVGPNGGLFHVTGHVEEIWDLDTDVVTAFSLNGRATELCSRIAP